MAPGRRRLIMLAVFVVLELIVALGFLGDHGGALFALSVIVLIPAEFLSIGVLTPRRAGAVAKLVGGALALILAFLLPVALAAVWLDHIGELRHGTVVEVRAVNGPRTHGLRYAVRTDDGEYFGTGSHLDQSNVGYRYEKGDRIDLYVDPTGLTDPQSVKAADRGHYNEAVWIAGVMLAVLIALNLIRTQPRSSPG